MQDTGPPIFPHGKNQLEPSNDWSLQTGLYPSVYRRHHRSPPLHPQQKTPDFTNFSSWLHACFTCRRDVFLYTHLSMKRRNMKSFPRVPWVERKTSVRVKKKKKSVCLICLCYLSDSFRHLSFGLLKWQREHRQGVLRPESVLAQGMTLNNTVSNCLSTTFNKLTRQIAKYL